MLMIISCYVSKTLILNHRMVLHAQPARLGRRSVTIPITHFEPPAGMSKRHSENSQPKYITMLLFQPLKFRGNGIFNIWTACFIDKIPYMNARERNVKLHEFNFATKRALTLICRYTSSNVWCVRSTPIQSWNTQFPQQQANSLHIDIILLLTDHMLFS